MNIIKNYQKVRLDKKINSYSLKVDNAAHFLTFLAVRKYIDQDFTSAERFKASRMLNMLYNYKKTFYDYIDADFLDKAKFLFTYINHQQEIFNLSYVFDLFVKDHPDYFNEKEVIKIKFLFNNFESNPKFKILNIFNADKGKIQELSIEYYLNNFKDVELKNIHKYKKYYKYIIILVSFISITFFI